MCKYYQISKDCYWGFEQQYLAYPTITNQSDIQFHLPTLVHSVLPCRPESPSDHFIFNHHFDRVLWGTGELVEQYDGMNELSGILEILFRNNCC